MNSVRIDPIVCPTNSPAGIFNRLAVCLTASRRLPSNSAQSQLLLLRADCLNTMLATLMFVKASYFGNSCCVVDLISDEEYLTIARWSDQ
ncbi:MAG: hypothetical protein PHI63_05845 [Patescibacteria group bacterium]|nr:hypothetical protein [Patescibacteria group bacterium]